MNSDDYYLPGAFAKAMGALERSDASWVAGAAINVDEYDQPRDTPLGPVWVPALPDDDEYRPRGPHGLVVRPWCVAQPASFWRRELFDRYGWFRGDVPYAFDVEFMTRLAIEGELPLLLPEDRLAACVLHSEAKSADPSKWEPDWKRMRRMHRKRLTFRERARLRRWELRAFFDPLHRAWGWVRFRLIHPVIRFGGNLLGRLPESIRPNIRTRDRRAP